MIRPSVNQVVGYVAPPAKLGDSPSIKKGVVTEVFNDEANTARIDISDPNNKDKDGNVRIAHAIATFNDDKKTENTWHVLEETPAPKPQPVPARATA
jgi:hypothetical protein